MVLEQLVTELLERNYKVFLRENNNEKWIIGGIYDEKATFKIGSEFQIRIENKQFKISFLGKQTVFDEKFDTTNDLLKFIETKFPMDT
jgi:hypothetical protein